jgi:hypothetical protein
MNLLKNRSRLVSFRLSPDELESLRVACLLKGSRNVSEFARGAVLELTSGRMQADAQLMDRFSLIEARVTELQGLVEHTHSMMLALARAVTNRAEFGRDDKVLKKGA